MAYVSQQLPEKEKNQFGNPDQTTPNPIPPQTSGGSAGDGSQGQGGVAPGVASSTQFGSNAAKLSDYLSANKEQVGAFGQKVAGNLTNQYNQAMGAIDTGYGNFGSDVNKGYTPYNEQLINQAAENPTEFVKNPENVSSFKSQYNDQYQGPENFQSYQPYADISNTVNKSVQEAGMTGNESGLKSYLGNYMNTGHNTPGMQTLDTLLLQRSPEARTTIQQAAQPFQDLTGYLGGKTNAANQSVADAKTQAEQTRQLAQNKFTGVGGVVPSFQSDLTNRLAQTKATQSNNANQALIDYQNGKATPEQMALIGIPNNEGNLQYAWDAANVLKNDYNAPVNWNALFTQNNPDVIYGSPGSAATEDDFAKAQALSQLTGQDLSGWMGANKPEGSLMSPNIEGLEGLNQQVSQRDIDVMTSDKANQLFQRFAGYGGDLGGLTNNMSADNLLQRMRTDPYAVAKIVNSGGLDPMLNTPIMTPAELESFKKAAARKFGPAALELQPGPSGYTGPIPHGGPLDPNAPTTGKMVLGSGEHAGQWFNGTSWVTAPVEYRGSGDSREQFDYTTGQYVSVPEDSGSFHI